MAYYSYFMLCAAIALLIELSVTFPSRPQLRYVSRGTAIGRLSFRSQMCIDGCHPSTAAGEAITLLDAFDTAFNQRMRQAKAEGVSPKVVEFRRAQSLKASGIQEERRRLKSACQLISQHCSELVLGIMCDSGSDGVAYLRKWVDSMSLPRGVLRAYDDLNEEIEYQTLANRPVYIKYNSSDTGNAYMKVYEGDFTGGVIFQPKLKDDGAFRQYGHLPLALMDTI